MVGGEGCVILAGGNGRMNPEERYEGVGGGGGGGVSCEGWCCFNDQTSKRSRGSRTYLGPDTDNPWNSHHERKR